MGIYLVKAGGIASKPGVADCMVDYLILYSQIFSSNVFSERILVRLAVRVYGSDDASGGPAGRSAQVQVPL